MRYDGTTNTLPNASVSIIGGGSSGTVAAKVDNIRRIRIVDNIISVEYISKSDDMGASDTAANDSPNIKKNVPRVNVEAPILRLKPDILPAG